jgi:hypothetical protein
MASDDRESILKNDTAKEEMLTRLQARISDLENELNGARTKKDAQKTSEGCVERGKGSDALLSIECSWR